MSDEQKNDSVLEKAEDFQNDDLKENFQGEVFADLSTTEQIADDDVSFVSGVMQNVAKVREETNSSNTALDQGNLKSDRTQNGDKDIDEVNMAENGGTNNSSENANPKPTTIEEPQDEDSAELFLVRPIVVYQLTDFEGPLDLLLTLVKEAKISIEDIFVSDVTRQYIDIIKNTPKEDFDFEYAGEFITMAAELIYIKSLRALPQEEIFEEEDDPESIKRAFIQKAKEYAVMKEQSEKLKEKETLNRFYREPKYTEKDCRVAITNFSLPKLIEAFAQVLIMADKMKKEEIPKTVMKEKFSVYDQMNNIRQLILDGGEVSFYLLFEKDFDKSDIVTTFLAILELMKYQKIKAEQDEETHDIKIYPTVEGDEAPIVFEEDDDGEY